MQPIRLIKEVRMQGKFELVGGLRFRRKVRAIITNSRGEFLLIRPHSFKEGAWTFVGGGVEENESVHQAIIREVAEEVGIREFISLKQSANRHQFSFSESNRAKRCVDYHGQIAELFWVNVPSDIPVIVQQEEIQSYIWSSLEDISKLVTVPAQLKMFESLFQEFKLEYRRNVA